MEKTNKICTLFAATVLLSCAAVAQAGPVNFKSVPADAKWLAHVDVDAARSSTVVRAFFAAVLKECPQAQEHFRDVGKKLGLEHATDLHGVTVYATKIGPPNVAIINANFNKQALKERIEKIHYRRFEYGNHEIYTWFAHAQGRREHGGHTGGFHGGHCPRGNWHAGDWRAKAWHRGGRHAAGHQCGWHGGHAHGHLVAASLYKPDVLVVACCPDLLKSALDVLDGKATNLNGKDSPLAAKVAAGTISLIRAVNVGNSAAAHRCALLRSIERFDYEKGEHDGKWFGQVTLTVASKSAAGDWKLIADGFRGLVALHLQKEPKLVELLHHAESSVNGKAVTVNFHESAGDVAAQMPAIAKLVVEHVKMHLARMHAMRHEEHGGHKPGCSAMHDGTCPMAGKKEMGGKDRAEKKGPATVKAKGPGAEKK